jgi:3-oxoacyl-[acyl-carrier protein] reductase
MNRIDLDWRIAIVTGAARGIGRALAERLSASRAKVAIWDVDGAAAAATSLALENTTYGIVGSTDAARSCRYSVNNGANPCLDAPMVRLYL